MSTFVKQLNDNVIYNDGINDYLLKTNSYVMPHPLEGDKILISDDANREEFDKCTIVDVLSVTVPIHTGRNDLVQKLSDRYFGEIAKIDDTRFFDDIGDGSGIKDFIGDYSSTLKKAIFKPQNDKPVFINRLIIFIKDSGSVDAGFYGNNITLTNGISIKKENQSGTLIKDITDGMPIMANGCYAKFGFSVSDISFGSGLNFLHVILTFTKNGSPLTLQPDEQLAIYLNDDFSKLEAHTFRAGAYEQ